DEVTFLYEVGEGVAHRSYGLNVAKLAGLPKVVLDVAGVKSRVMEKEEGRRRIENTSRVLSNLLSGDDQQHLDSLIAGIEQL
ncbi:Mismatch repair protein msh3, partial [Elasticomyces elasticus]